MWHDNLKMNHVVAREGKRISKTKDKWSSKSQIDKERKYTFAKGLKSILRQDPDIVMVGEIRDSETADISINAALTGHLVISTIHTNSAFGAIPRFLSLDAKPYLLAPALNVVIGQRLVRRICPDCKKEYEISAEQKREILGKYQEIFHLSEKAAADLFSSVSFLLKEDLSPVQNAQKLLAPSGDKFTSEQASLSVSLFRHISRLEGPENSFQKEVISSFEGYFRNKFKAASEWA